MFCYVHVCKENASVREISMILISIDVIELTEIIEMHGFSYV